VTDYCEKVLLILGWGKGLG